MPTGESFKVHVRSNDGSDNYHPATDEPDALQTAKKHRNAGNYMVCIETDGVRAHRWDRNKIEGENRWRRVDPDNFETLGRLRIVRRVV